MAKSTKRNNSDFNSSLKKEIYGIIIFGISLIIALSIYIRPTGIAGVFIRDFTMGMFGISAYIFPIYFLIIGAFFIIKRGKAKFNRKFYYVTTLLYIINVMLTISYSSKLNNLKFIEKLKEAYLNGISLKGGGVIGELLASPMIYIFGSLGTYIILICTIIILVILITERSLLFSTLNFIEGLKNKNKLRKQIIKDSKNDSEKIEDENNEAEVNELKENIEKIDKKIKIVDFLKETKEKEIKDDFKVDKIEDKETAVDELNDQISSRNSNLIEYKFPPIDLLSENKFKGGIQDKKELLQNAKLLEDTLNSFGVEAKVIQVNRGPSVTRYEVQPSAGVKVSRIVNLSDDIALNLAAPSVRIEAPIPGKSAIGIEVPNKEVVPVTLREVIESKEFNDFKSNLAFALGKDITGKCIVADLAKMPHLLIAGATGSGKSVCINTLITSIIYKSSPNEVKMLLVDPKVVELSIYNGIPHLLIPVVTEPKKAASALYWAVNEMTNRYKAFAENNVRNIEGYNELMNKIDPSKKMPKIVIVIDELADLMMVAPNDVEDAICRLAQMARAAGMHLVIATQRPSVDVITGVIKANIPSRIAFAVSSQVDSRTILDMSGAERLLGRGDMLFMPIGESKPIRIQGAFISDKEVEDVVNYLKNNSNTEYKEDIIDDIENNIGNINNTNDDYEDELFSEAVNIAIESGQISASMLQRRLRIGFNRAARLIEEMESRGIVGKQEGSKPRQVLISKQDVEKY
ncbi:FtsK/SpoIIIE family DNA translocase [Thermobrachium celere]|uniref:Cell division protein FtsK n=1 Tax=Thermobrachium celere DSM 8682 TaxID=941824 RepID=R7RPI4_9CLOT|nr:DNA translocase FtsK [Thermobrachium celere]CDF57964.1 Cell division protein FtsK [Thermobrachium celere DSM 8682]